MKIQGKIVPGMLFISMVAVVAILAMTGSSSQSSPVSPAAPNLGTAADYVILSKSGISTTGTTSVIGDLGVSPIASTAVTGFNLVMHSTNTYSTSSIVNGKVYAANYAAPTTARMIKAVGDMEMAYHDAVSRQHPTATELGAGDVSGMTVTPGVYKWGTGLLITTALTLDGKGDKNAIFIFQIAGNLTVANGAAVILRGGVQARNVFWQSSGQATLGTACVVQGNILSHTAIVMNKGAKLNGRALAQTAVTLDANAVVKPT